MQGNTNETVSTPEDQNAAIAAPIDQLTAERIEAAYTAAREEEIRNRRPVAEWRARRRPWFEGFPGDHEWSDLAGEAMTTAKWDDPATAGFCLRSLAPARRYVVEVDRGERVVTII